MTKFNSNRKRLSHMAKLSLVGGCMAAALSGVANADCGRSGTVGEICLMASSFCPSGTAEANGATLEIESYQMLYAVIGTNFGGDGQTTFMLPDLRGRVPVGAGNGNGLSPVELGEPRGYEIAAIPSSGKAIGMSGGPDTIPVAAPGTIDLLNPQLGIRYCIIAEGNVPQR